MQENRNIYKISSGRPEGKMPLGVRTLTWKNNIEIYIKEMACRCWMVSSHSEISPAVLMTVRNIPGSYNCGVFFFDWLNNSYL
jgi:hypothetical protein